MNKFLNNIQTVRNLAPLRVVPVESVNIVPSESSFNLLKITSFRDFSSFICSLQAIFDKAKTSFLTLTIFALLLSITLPKQTVITFVFFDSLNFLFDLLNIVSQSPLI